MAVKVEVSRPLSILEVDMMNNKWIVPIVAMILCAVSLIGAGYAAYTATLVDNETATVDQNYVVLTTGEDYVKAGEVDVYWDYSLTYTGGVAGKPVYEPYLDVGTTDGVHYATIFVLSVSKDVSNIGGEVTDSDSYTLAIGPHSCSNITLTGTEIKVFTDAALTSEAANLSALTYGTEYYIALGYQHNGEDDLNGTVPSASATVTVSVTATANLVTKS